MLGTGDTVFHRLIFSSSSGKTCLPSTKVRMTFMTYMLKFYESCYELYLLERRALYKVVEVQSRQGVLDFALTSTVGNDLTDRKRYVDESCK